MVFSCGFSLGLGGPGLVLCSFPHWVWLVCWRQVTQPDGGCEAAAMPLAHPASESSSWLGSRSQGQH